MADNVNLSNLLFFCHHFRPQISSQAASSIARVNDHQHQSTPEPFQYIPQGFTSQPVYRAIALSCIILSSGQKLKWFTFPRAAMTPALFQVLCIRSELPLCEVSHPQMQRVQQTLGPCPLPPLLSSLGPLDSSFKNAYTVGSVTTNQPQCLSRSPPGYY